MLGKTFLLLLLLVICTNSLENTCYLDSSSFSDCNNVSDICANASTIVTAADTNYQCQQSLVLVANTLNISGNYSGLDVTGSQINI